MKGIHPNSATPISKFYHTKRFATTAVIQRVKSASVTVDGQLISQISKGILVFAAVGKDDTLKEAESMAGKVLKVKLWEDDSGVKWKKNVQEIHGEVLCVSQFTLLASTKKGNKPDFHRSAAAEKGKELYDGFVKKIRREYHEDRVKDGVFQAMMDVGLVNDGPVGLDYRCVDEAVYLPMLPQRRFCEPCIRVSR